VSAHARGAKEQKTRNASSENSQHVFFIVLCLAQPTFSFGIAARPDHFNLQVERGVHSNRKSRFQTHSRTRPYSAQTLVSIPDSFETVL
jgi:hypothetical protein